jgi:hypothetical protein
MTPPHSIQLIFLFAPLFKSPLGLGIRVFRKSMKGISKLNTGLANPILVNLLIQMATAECVHLRRIFGK